MVRWQRYSGAWRGLRFLHSFNNVLHREALQYNAALYRQFGLKQSAYSPISSATFEGFPPGELPLLDREGVDIAVLPGFAHFPTDVQAQLLAWPEKGYLILRGFFAPEQVEQANREVAALLEKGQADFNYTGRKLMQAWKRSHAVRVLFTDPQLREVLAFILGRRVIPFHTINFIYGSQQKAHSDAIHMATYPQGFLIAAWVALDTIGEKNGPLFVYPGSHRLPYPTNKVIGAQSSRFWLDQDANEKYERYAERLLKEAGYPPETFYAQPGDVLLWHANLVHGGAPHMDMQQTRRSMAMHYFAEGTIPYHEISERPAIMEREMLNLMKK